MSSSLCQLILPSYAVSAFSTIFTISNALASIVSRIDGNVCPCMYISSWLLAHSCEILSALEDKIRIPAQPCNILYLLIFNSSLYNLRSPVFFFYASCLIEDYVGWQSFHQVAAPTLTVELFSKELRAITTVNSFKAHLKTSFENCISVINYYFFCLFLVV